ncbi:hypothetical protein GTW51_15470 [Aurantimonas aggregata]|uniref:Uncharacterized protein n=1 Tax=Aurantimonas aggregata TaxID=2047720 RepID=A0A6L9MKU8_9HYPH|nr:hypothetical protein [Aurantimonas aggregata]NDV88100.1 hypothetical protein [Aurantimonas aggregata]
MASYCKASVIDRVVPPNLPVSGGNHYGFFAAYGTQKSTTTILEIDPEQRIVFWTLSDDAVEGDFACALKAFD